MWPLTLQVKTDGGTVEVCGQWNLASPLLPVSVNGADRMLQVTPPGCFHRAEAGCM